MDYDLAIKFYVLMLAMATAGTVVTFVSRKSYDIATCCYGFAMFLSMCFAMLDWFVPEKVGATSLSTTFDTYLMLVLMGMTFLCYKYDMRHKADVNRRLEEAHLENLRQRNELLSGVGVVDIAEGDVVEIMVDPMECDVDPSYECHPEKVPNSIIGQCHARTRPVKVGG